MMTVYLAFESIKKNKSKMSDRIVVSQHAASARPCKLGLETGQTITLKEAILATIIKSANDAARVIAEKISGTESKFALAMNQKARQLGMHKSHFRNASGWHDPMQKTTAEDLVKLAIALKRDFPEYYPLFSQTSFTFNDKIYNGHNHVTKNYPGADGLKTGYVAASGYNLVTSVKRGEKQLIGVVIGGRTSKERDNKMIALMNHHFGEKISKTTSPKPTKQNNSIQKAPKNKQDQSKLASINKQGHKTKKSKTKNGYAAGKRA
jgi:D-alanyl-D-alanine carboxypeptidase (penicillin-binding protein 5/6)